MKFKISTRKNGSKRYQSIPEGKTMTDQSDKNMVNINTIMANYAKTGILPQFPEKIEQYLDVTQIPSYMEAQEQIAEARDLFMQLPATIRKDMNNNPQNLESYLTDERNKEKLIKYGILKKKVEPEKPADPPKAQPAVAKKPEKQA